MKKLALVCALLICTSIWFYHSGKTSHDSALMDKSQAIKSSSISQSSPAAPIAQKTVDASPSLDEQIHALQALSDDEIRLKIKETDDQFQKTGLIEKANKGSLTEQESKELRSMLRIYHALQILKFQRMQS